MKGSNRNLLDAAYSLFGRVLSFLTISLFFCSAWLVLVNSMRWLRPVLPSLPLPRVGQIMICVRDPNLTDQRVGTYV